MNFAKSLRVRNAGTPRVIVGTLMTPNSRHTNKLVLLRTFNFDMAKMKMKF